MKNPELLLLIPIGLFIIIIVFFVIKRHIWDDPQEEIKRLNERLDDKYNEIKNLKIDHTKTVKEMNEAIVLNSNSFRKEIKDLESNISLLKEENKELKEENKELKERLNASVFVSDVAKSNLRAIPYMAAIMADFETYGLEKLARKLDWGGSEERLKKVKAIREIRKDAEAMVARNKEAYYQLEYLLRLFPNLEDVIETEYESLPIIDVNEISNYDVSRDYLTKDEYEKLSTTERNQLALDRYRSSKNKSKWQIGRDYELYVGYRFSLKNYSVDYFGSYMGLEDLGRDIIAKRDDEILIVQCKYWSSKKQIHENHVNQLFGTVMCYCIENNLPTSKVKGVLITNIELSDTAKKMARMLNIRYIENYQSGDYPCIKCNINRNEYGEITKIYHSPFDQQYDAAKIDQPGEFMAMTVAEAEAAGFRRAFRWFGSQ